MYVERGSRGDGAFGLSLGLEVRLRPMPWVPSSLPWPEALWPQPLSPRPPADHSAVRSSPWNRFHRLCHSLRWESRFPGPGHWSPPTLTHTEDSCKRSWLVSRSPVMFGVLVIGRGNAFVYHIYLSFINHLLFTVSFCPIFLQISFCIYVSHFCTLDRSGMGM